MRLLECQTPLKLQDFPLVMIDWKHNFEVFVVVWVINVLTFFFLSGSNLLFHIFLNHFAICICLLICCLISRFLLNGYNVQSRSLVVLSCITWAPTVDRLHNNSRILRAVLNQLNTLVGRNAVVFCFFWLDLHRFEFRLVFFLCDFDRFENGLDGESQQGER